MTVVCVCVCVITSDTSDLAPDSTPDFTPTDGVLERIEKMREQWDGMHTEFAQLQDR